MVGQMTLDHPVQVRILVLQPIRIRIKSIKSEVETMRRYRLGARTGDSQSSNRGSIPRSAANLTADKRLLRSNFISWDFTYSWVFTMVFCTAGHFLFPRLPGIIGGRSEVSA
jgi:hypothetical protein